MWSVYRWYEQDGLYHRSSHFTVTPYRRTSLSFWFCVFSVKVSALISLCRLEVSSVRDCGSSHQEIKCIYECSNVGTLESWQTFGCENSTIMPYHYHFHVTFHAQLLVWKYYYQSTLHNTKEEWRCSLH